MVLLPGEGASFGSSGLLGQLRKCWLGWRGSPSQLPRPSPSWERETDLKPLAASDPEPGAGPPPCWVHSSTCQAHWDSWPLRLNPAKPALAPRRGERVPWIPLHPSIGMSPVSRWGGESEPGAAVQAESGESTCLLY